MVNSVVVGGEGGGEMGGCTGGKGGGGGSGEETCGVGKVKLGRKGLVSFFLSKY